MNRSSRWRIGLIALAALALATHALSSFVEALEPVRDPLYHGLLLGSALACLARARARRTNRVPWLLVGIGVFCWALGDLYWSAALADLEAPPYPSLADAGWIVFYPLTYVAVLLLLRDGLAKLPRTVWLDGLVAGLAFSAAGIALGFEPIFAVATEGTAAQIATNLAYPVGDLLLLAMTTFVFAVYGWRPGLRWCLIAAALVASVIVDSAYMYMEAIGTYEPDALLATLWPLSTVLLATAAWQARPQARARLTHGWAAIAMPSVFTFVAIALLVHDHFARLNGVVVWLAAAALVMAAVRAALTFREYLGLIEESRDQAGKDPLTGLANRRAFMADLGRAIATADSRPFGLALFDLDGFKAYNDAFGHLAGDDLLQRLAARFAGVVPAGGRAYRLGGDEFCALIPDHASFRTSVAAISAALCERGNAFTVTSSVGCVLVPEEAKDARQILALADRRMYAQKGGKRHSAGNQMRNVLLSALREREPELDRHMEAVAALAGAVGREMGLDSEGLDELVRAAELHDIGKLAVPDEILRKPGPLDEREWEFMRNHTLVGERILSSAPALLPVARLVRSSHERWDGGGYPDGLAGDDIPLGSRIIFACDAFHAMTSERPYSLPRSLEEAVTELCRCAGSQFDPAVVAALRRVLDAQVPAERELVAA